MSAPTRHPAVRTDACARTLAAIRERGVALAIWRRRLAGDLAAAVAAWQPEASRRLTLRPADAATFTAGMPRPLADDVTSLLHTAAAVGGWSRLEARLEVTRGVPCPRFHVDRVHTRLLCTYRGRATQFMPDETPEAQPHDLACGDVAILKGSLHPDGTRPISHRSPPANPDGPARLLLVIDGVA